MKVILASGSEPRKDIFDKIGIKYEIIKSEETENSNAKEPEEYVKDLSKIKANDVAKRVKEKAIIISADTIIYMDGKVYEKPKSKEEAFENLKEMSGKLTYAYTGVTIKDLYQNKDITFYDVCKVYINEVTDEEINWYVNNTKNIFKRCGYALCDKADLFLNRIEGDYNTLYGISPSKVYGKLKELGYTLSDFELIN